MKQRLERTAKTDGKTAAAANVVVVFVTDTGFLAPSLLVAQQLVKQSIHELADIVIYTVDVEPALVESLSRHPANRHVRFESLPSELFAPPPGITFLKNHVPTTSLARLALHEVIPPHYDRIVYIDGDVQIVGDVSELIRCPVPDGKIMAGRGSAWLDAGRSSGLQTPPSYLSDLGGVSEMEYFNCGVLAFTRATWMTAAPKALKFFFDNSEACIRHDQSALNAVFKGNVIHFSPRYNFHSAYAALHVQNRYEPAIIHFTGPRKPWGDVCAPWGSRFQRSYRQLVTEQPELVPHLSIKDCGRARSLLRDAKAWHRERSRLSRNRTEISARRDAFFAYIDATVFPC